MTQRVNLLRATDTADEPGFFSRLYDMVESILNGKTRNKGAVTLANGAATTVVTNVNFESSQIPVFTPLTANAAAEIGAGGMYISSRGVGTFTITHANNAQTDRDFEYIFAG